MCGGDKSMCSRYTYSVFQSALMTLFCCTDVLRTASVIMVHPKGNSITYPLVLETFLLKFTCGKSAWFILWAPRMPVDNLMLIHPIVVEIEMDQQGTNWLTKMPIKVSFIASLDSVGAQKTKASVVTYNWAHEKQNAWHCSSWYRLIIVFWCGLFFCTDWRLLNSTQHLTDTEKHSWFLWMLNSDTYPFDPCLRRTLKKVKNEKTVKFVLN